MLNERLSKLLLCVAMASVLVLSSQSQLAAQDSADGPLVLKRSFMKGWRYTHEGSESDKVFHQGGWSLNPEFESLLAGVPEAQAEARSAVTWNKIGVGLAVLALVEGIVVVSRTVGSDDIATLESGSDRLLGLALGTALVGVVTSAVGNGHMKKAGERFNEARSPGDGASPRFARVLPTPIVLRTSGGWAPGLAMRLR